MMLGAVTRQVAEGGPSGEAGRAENGPYVIYAPSARGTGERGSVEWRADHARSR